MAADPFYGDCLVGSTGICSISILLPAEKGTKDLNRNNTRTNIMQQQPVYY